MHSRKRSVFTYFGMQYLFYYEITLFILQFYKLRFIVFAKSIARYYSIRRSLHFFPTVHKSHLHR